MILKSKSTVVFHNCISNKSIAFNGNARPNTDFWFDYTTSELVIRGYKQISPHELLWWNE